MRTHQGGEWVFVLMLCGIPAAKEELSAHVHQRTHTQGCTLPRGCVLIPQRMHTCACELLHVSSGVLLCAHKERTLKNTCKCNTHMLVHSAQEYGFLHMSTGELLRAEVDEGTEIVSGVEGKWKVWQRECVQKRMTGCTISSVCAHVAVRVQIWDACFSHCCGVTPDARVTPTETL